MSYLLIWSANPLHRPWPYPYPYNKLLPSAFKRTSMRQTWPAFSNAKTMSEMHFKWEFKAHSWCCYEWCIRWMGFTFVYSNTFIDEKGTFTLWRYFSADRLAWMSRYIWWCLVFYGLNDTALISDCTNDILCRAGGWNIIFPIIIPRIDTYKSIYIITFRVVHSAIENMHNAFYISRESRQD